jgi:D-amino-acid dehydrogenase
MRRSRNFIASSAIRKIGPSVGLRSRGKDGACGARTRVAVIGAGIVGVTTASFLLRKGHDVVLLDPAEPGGGASFGNAGCFNGSSVVPMAMPGTIRPPCPQVARRPAWSPSLPLFYLPRVAPC